MVVRFHSWGIFLFLLLLQAYILQRVGNKKSDIHGIDSLKAGLGYFHDRFHAAILLKQGCTLTPGKNPVCSNCGFSQNSMSLFSGLAELRSNLLFICVSSAG